VIELFAVAPEQDADFIAAWTAQAPPGATLYRALRDGERLRFASLMDGPDTAGGVLLIVPLDGGEAAWEPVRQVLATRQGYLGAQVRRDADGRRVAVVHWSSPLMYARTVRTEGDLMAPLGHPALYARVGR
jgi:hypothetical protein